MATIALPEGAKFRNLRWTHRTPAQANRSIWTSKRQVVGLPGATMWMAEGEFVAIVGERNQRPLRSFWMQLRGIQNSFRVPATEGPQFNLSIAPKVNGGGQTAALTGTLATDGWHPNMQMLEGNLLTIAGQLVVLIAPFVASAAGEATIAFAPGLRSVPADNADIEAVRPWCEMTLAEPMVAWTVEPGQVYSQSVSLEELV
ncbi:hypothetical protein ABC347_07755 [Sphingomonas sp. 1P06PA]|uniref:hypothetical protein n=1 Tax=Sphingomonas sp. 1P06PA TaxID=554121 RepID=UPI0039A554C6